MKIKLALILLIILSFLNLAGAIAAPAKKAKLCKFAESARTFIIENNTEATLQVARYFPFLPELPTQGPNRKIEVIGEVPPLTELSFGEELKIGRNIIAMNPACNGQLVTNSAGKAIEIRRRFNDKRSKRPNCARTIKFIVVDNDLGVVPFSCTAPAPFGNFGGDWNCPGRGLMTITQSGGIIDGGIFGGEASQDWNAQNGMDGSIANGAVEGSTMSARLDHSNGTYSLVLVTLAPNGQSFSGSWTWYNGASVPSGTWSCNR
ncbi:MAG: hypothetical protein DCC75_11130 [Proteobacteria bacterium]|nr:MAG: hypothetical protein DCC75_11130 [Pseudomonadota bacterium]